MSESPLNRRCAPSGRSTIADVLEEMGPVGDLSRFMLDDLTAEEEDEFFKSPEDA